MSDKIVAYTDGSACVKGEKLGGFGVYIIDGEKEYCYKQGFKNTKTGRAELHGLICCLQKITVKEAIIDIYCDSEYVVKTISEKRLWKWKRIGWVGVKNVDLLIILLEEYTKFRIPPKLHHIKGHTKNEDIHSLGNAIVDQLASYKNQTSYKTDIIDD